MQPSAYSPGILSQILALHMEYYAPNWGFGLPFETKVATELAAFLSRYDPNRHLFLNLHQNKALAGTITLDADDPQGAHLRWFMVSPKVRGTGLGRFLMQSAIDFAKTSGAPSIWLTTFKGLDAAAHLYTSFGFTCVQESAQDQWNGNVIEQRYELVFNPSNPL